MPAQVLGPEFFARHTVTVARELLGMYLIARDAEGHELGGRITEAEAYRQHDDPACHSFGGRRTARTESMYAPPGHLYVYRIHQVFCLNLTTEAEGEGCAVLIRAIVPSDGLALMQARRRNPDPRQLTNGPGKLCQAMGIDLSWNGEPLGARLRVEDRGIRIPDADVAATPRIGISRGQDLLWRFVTPSG